ncbi:DUF6114 domain-containing protein [Micromonospora sp. NPDC023956]|uniref:DUF6114 domain-containing protein n=1 Tax=Micromonospora sp. NPDC023956 TaxID=3155722 RepID=UPI0033E65BE3
MTSADPQHARPGGFTQARGRFHRWRRSRPFWGGLLTALAGVQIFGTTQMSLGGLTFQMGPTGFLSWVIPTVLVACGMFMWFTPQHRMFYAVVAAVTALFSLIGVNLGGFFVGLVLGMVGSALGFAWVPARAPAAPAREAASAGPLPAVAPSAVAPSVGVPSVGPGPANPPETDDRDRTLVDEIMPVEREAGLSPRDPRFLAGAVALLSLGVAGLLGLNGPTAVRAAPAGSACPTPTAPATSGPTPTASAPSSPTPTASAPSGAPDPSATSGDDTPDPDPGTALPTTPAGSDDGPVTPAAPDATPATDVVGATGNLRTGDDARARPAPIPAPVAATPGTAPGGTPTARPAPAGTSTTPPTCATPTPDDPDDPEQPGPVQPGRPLPRIDAEPGQPTVGTPSKLTGSKVVMTGIRFEGVVDLRTVDGTLRALKFSMRRAVTDDFALQSTGTAGRPLRYATDQLTVDGDVAFYATRFTGRLTLLGGPGLVTVTLTPDLPFPDGIPITAPQLVFQDPVMDLAYVDCDVLTTGDEPLRLTLP